MERIDGLLPDAGRAMSGSSANRGSSPTGPALRLDDQVCPHCSQELQAEFFEFPPALKHKYGKPGEWYYHPCTSECEKKNERREWELMRRDARVATLRERSGLSKRMKGYTLGNFRPTVSNAAGRARVKVDGYLEDWEENREAGKGLYFCGGVGTGKTHLAVAVMNELIRKKRTPSLFVTVPELLDNLRETYNKPGRNLDEWMDMVQNAEFLYLEHRTQGPRGTARREDGQPDHRDVRLDRPRRRRLPGDCREGRTLGPCATSS
jgi:DNA replication protein DnaC